MKQLTDKQQGVLDMITQYQLQNGYPPTRIEIALHFGFKSSNAAEEYIKALVKKGAIQSVPGQSRGIRLPDNSKLGLPVIGKVAAGTPILAIQHISEHLDIQGSAFSPNAHFLLRVQGKSMINAGIDHDDLLAVHKTTTAVNGEIIVARIGEEVTVKRFKKLKSQIILLAENEDFDPIHIKAQDASQFAIEGKAVGIIRRSI